MPKLLLTTKVFALELLRVELETFTKKSLMKEKEGFSVELEETEIKAFLEKVYFSSRSCEYVYLYDEMLNVFSFPLTKRVYLHSHSPFTSLHRSFLFSRLALSKKKRYACIDPCAGYGELILELASYLRASPLHERHRFEIPLFKEKNILLKPQRSIVPDSFFQAIVQENKELKFLKENAEASKEKVSFSQYTFDWLDVKWKKKEFDVFVTELRKESCEESLLEELFYQAEFLAKNLATLSNFSLPLKLLTKAKLQKKEEIECESGIFVTVYERIPKKKKER